MKTKAFKAGRTAPFSLSPTKNQLYLSAGFLFVLYKSEPGILIILTNRRLQDKCTLTKYRN